MPCDDILGYVGCSEVENSPRITDESRRSGNKIVGNSSRSSYQTQQVAAVGSSRSNYGTVAMAPRPLHSATTFSTSCSSSSASSSSSSSSSSACSSSCSPSSFDRAQHQHRNESTNSSSSLILILERPGPTDALILTDNDNKTITKSNFPQISQSSLPRDGTNSELNLPEIPTNRNDNEKSAVSGFSGRGANSSIENLAKKKSSSRCRRRRSATSPRNIRNQRSISRDTNGDNYESAESSRSENREDGFVATSTLTKNRENTEVPTNTSEKLKIESTDLTELRFNCGERNIKSLPEIALNPYAQSTVVSQQSTISVASIRGTNVGSLESPCNGVKVSEDFGINCNSSSVSVPSIHHRQAVSCVSRVANSKTTSSSSFLPRVDVSSAESSPGSSSRGSAKPKKNKTTEPMTITTCKSTRASPVKSAGTGQPRSTTVAASLVFATGKATARSTEESAATRFARVESAISLKSLSFTNDKMLEINRDRGASIHASLGQLPITNSYSGPSVALAASLENVDRQEIARAVETNVNPVSIPINLYSAATPNDNAALMNKTSVERVCFSTGASTMSSTSSKTPIRSPPSAGNSMNVVTAFKNSLINAANNCNNNNNNNNNNGRCNHMSGTCVGACATTTSQTSSTLTRTPNLVSGIASTSSWANNSTETETDYVVDPVQGNAYHKGQFLGKVSCLFYFILFFL